MVKNSVLGLVLYRARSSAYKVTNKNIEKNWADDAALGKPSIGTFGVRDSTFHAYMKGAVSDKVRNPRENVAI